MKVHTHMTPDNPWMTSDNLENIVKNGLNLVIVPTKFHDHITLNTNRIPKSVKNMQISYRT